MKKTLKNLVLGISISTVLITTNLNAKYPNPEFITRDNHISQVKKELKKIDEKFDRFAKKDERKDYDGDGIKEVSIVYTKKGNIYYVSSKDFKEKKSDKDKWIWYKTN